MDITPHIVLEAPPTVLYIPDFITEDEEEYLLHKVYSAPIPKWTQLRNRRLQNWGGSPQPNGMIIEDIPQWLQLYLNKVNDLNLYDKGNLKANHVLINEYLPGQGIMPHVDGPLFSPTIITITCGSHAVLKFQKQTTNTEIRNKEDKIDNISLLLERRSLIALMDSMYTDYLHSIEEKTEDFLENIINLNKTKYTKDQNITRDTRISFTIRHVLKTSKFNIKNLIYK